MSPKNPAPRAGFEQSVFEIVPDIELDKLTCPKESVLRTAACVGEILRLKKARFNKAIARYLRCLRMIA
jgi:hypothetical protein